MMSLRCVSHNETASASNLLSPAPEAFVGQRNGRVSVSERRSSSQKLHASDIPGF